MGVLEAAAAARRLLVNTTVLAKSCHSFLQDPDNQLKRILHCPNILLSTSLLLCCTRPQRRAPSPPGKATEPPGLRPPGPYRRRNRKWAGYVPGYPAREIHSAVAETTWPSPARRSVRRRTRRRRRGAGCSWAVWRPWIASRATPRARSRCSGF